MNTKQIIIPTILVMSMMLMTIGPAAAGTPFSVWGFIHWSDGTPCNEPAIGHFEINNTGTSQVPFDRYYSGGAHKYNISTTDGSNYYSLTMEVPENATIGDILLFNISATSPTLGTETNTTLTATATGVDINWCNITLDAAAVTEPDLIVESIAPNCAGYLFANQSNGICAKIKNTGTVAANASDVWFNVSDGSGWYNATVAVPEIPAGENTTVCITDPTDRDTGTAVTINVTADCYNNVTEGSGESNNDASWNGNVVNTGYKGKFYTNGGPNMTTWRTYDLNGTLIYSPGDSEYLSSYSYPDWTDYNAIWTASDLSVPHIGDPDNASNVVEARLYVMYTWAKGGVIPGYVSMEFNGNSAYTLDEHYWDEKGYPTSNPYGMLVYNVTDDYNPSGPNTANLTNSYIGGDNASMRGMMLVVVCENEYYQPRRTIVINEEFDLLYGGSSYCTTPQTATAWAPISGTSLPYGRLITFAPGADGSGSAGEGELIFNGQVWNDAWRDNEYHQIGVSDLDVSTYLSPTSNLAGFQSNADWMEASNAFLLTSDMASVETVTGTGTASFSVDSGTIEDLVAVQVDPTTNPPRDFPHGIFSLNITGLSLGETVNVTVMLPANVADNSEYWIINDTAGNSSWYPVTLYDNDGDNVLIFEVTDGGPGDHDGIENGVIYDDPGGPASSAVTVGIDPCPVMIGSNPADRATMNISLWNIQDYGSGTIHLYYDTSVVEVDSISNGDSESFTSNPVYPPSGPVYYGGGHVKISASNTTGYASCGVYPTEFTGASFVEVTFRPTGASSDCTDLKLVVETLYDRNYTALMTNVINCTCPSGGLHIVESGQPIVSPPIASPAVILNDTQEMRARVQQTAAPFCTNVTNLTVFITDATAVAEVYVDLSPILGAGHETVRMSGPDGSAAGTWYIETNASYSSLSPYSLNVMANDPYDAWNNGSSFTLTVDRRGDIRSPTLTPDNMVDSGDYLYIARYTVGLDPAPEDCTAQIVPANGWNGVDMADALYIAMYEAHKPPFGTYGAP